jgi:hypothetical protein
MVSEINKEIELEIGHVLFIDIAGFGSADISCTQAASLLTRISSQLCHSRSSGNLPARARNSRAGRSAKLPNRLDVQLLVGWKLFGTIIFGSNSWKFPPVWE